MLSEQQKKTKALPERIRYAADNKNYACVDPNCKAHHDAEYIRADGPDTSAAAMRDLCVAKVRAMGQQWYVDAKKRGAAFSDKGRLAETIAAELESLTLKATTKAEGS